MNIIKKNRLLYILPALLLFTIAGGAQNAHALTLTCNTNCSPSYSSYVGVVTMNPICTALSPSSFNVNLSVNGVSIPTYTKTCPTQTPNPIGGGSSSSNSTSNTVVTQPLTTPSSCQVPWSQYVTIADGASVKAYKNFVAVAPQKCTSQTRVCTAGTLSGTYVNKSCATIQKGTCSIDQVGTPPNCRYPNPKISFYTSPTRVHKGDYSTITWTTKDTKSCKVTGTKFLATGINGKKKTQINNSSTYTIACIDILGKTMPTKTTKVNVIPKFVSF